MSSLFVYHVSSPEIPNKVLTHLEDIAATLAEQGIHFDRWQTAAPIRAGASHEEVIDAYREQIDQLMTERGDTTGDVISLDRDHPQKAELRARFLDEHRYSEDEQSIVKQADALCAYLKCLEELSAGNNEFTLAKARLDKTLEQRRSPEMDYFMEVFIPSFSLSLDEISLDSSL